MADKTGRQKRRTLNLAVKKEFQLWLLSRILGAVVLSSLVAAAILFFYARNEVASSFFDAHIKIRRVSDLLLPVVLAGSGVSLISGALIALFLPQKIAGPIFRMEQDLQAVKEGDHTVTIKLRRGDPFTELAASINQLIGMVRDRNKKP